MGECNLNVEILYFLKYIIFFWDLCGHFQMDSKYVLLKTNSNEVTEKKLK